LARSLFERLVEEGVRPVMLQVQYRMHPGISAFPAAEFYRGLLRDGVAASERMPPAGFDWPNRQVPVAFVGSCGRVHSFVGLMYVCAVAFLIRRGNTALADVHGQESREREAGRRSKTNRAEAEVVTEVPLLHAAVCRMINRVRVSAVCVCVCLFVWWAQIVERLLRSGMSARELGIITPYNGQLKLLQDMADRAASGAVGQVSMSTVDGFQGREKGARGEFAVERVARGCC
jgi:superfamily I DNA and/or RNA helicase